MGGCASKPKDLDTRKVPGPAVRKPHAPPEKPVSPRATAETVALEKKDGDENKAGNLVDVTEPAPPKIKEAAAPPIIMEAVPAAAKEEKNVVTGVVPEVEKKEVDAPKEETKDEFVETLVPKEEKKDEFVETIVPMAEKKGEVVEETVVPKVTEVVVVQGGRREVVETIMAELKKDDVAEIVVPEEVFSEVAETVAQKEVKKDEVAEKVVPKEEKKESVR